MTIDTIIKVIGLLIQVITVAMKTFEDIMEKGTGKTKKELVMLLAKDALGDETYQYLHKHQGPSFLWLHRRRPGIRRLHGTSPRL